ncbi:MAG TPA: PAS domain-containing protein [Puia sp.]|nr:PAS domain-containing protein [Puia sp.]
MPRLSKSSLSPTSSGHLHRQAFDNSLQANIIFIVSNGRIVKANKAACKLLGYPKKELLVKNRKDLFNITESGYKRMLRQRKIEGFAKADLSVIKKNGNLLSCEITSVIFKDDNGISNSILSMVDLSERLLKQKNIDADNQQSVADNIVIAQSKSDNRDLENTDWIKSIARTSYDLIWDWDITSDHISFGGNYEKVFGYSLQKYKIPFKEWIALFLSEEGKAIEKKINRIFQFETNNWEDTYSFTCPDGSPGQVISRANIVRDKDGKAIRMIGVIHDISKLQKLEGILEGEIRDKEKQIIEAIVEAKEMERSDIGKELHDNINQLLGASMLYLDMARKNPGDSEIYLIHSSEYTLTAIEEIRKLTKGLVTDNVTNFGLCGAIRNACRDTMETYPIKIHCSLEDTGEETMSGKFKLNIFRMFQEQLNNILKHARASTVHISYSQMETGYTLTMEDNGVGFDTTNQMKGVGINNIISRAELYKGEARFISEPGKGCLLIVSFPPSQN